VLTYTGTLAALVVVLAVGDYWIRRWNA